MVNDRIKRGISYEDESQVWWQLWSEGRFLPKNRKLTPIRYLTGLTALNLMMEGRTAPGWHSTYLFNRASWAWSGDLIRDTTPILGYRGIYNATEELRRHVSDLSTVILAASYERAVFDILYHYVVECEPVPNIQAKDIDHEVDFSLVRQWINESDINSERLKARMLSWLPE